jgi:transcription antitermination factor NusA-like protein
VPNKYFGGLIGRGGQNRKAMSERTGARIFFSDSDESREPRNPSANRPIYIYGTPETIQHAVAAIHEEMSKQDSQPR